MSVPPAVSTVGPADRTTFFEEQARHRRRTARFAVISAMAVLAAGVPLSLVVTPVCFLVTLVVAHLVQLATPLPAAFWGFVDGIGGLVPALLQQVDRASESGAWSAIDTGLLTRFGVLAIAPGMAVTLLTWIWVRALLRAGGVGGVLARIGAREARPQYLEERQLANLVEEMAIAGGVKPPRLLVLELDEPNAAAIGATRDDAAIVVTRGLLERLDRDETQAVIGHLVGSVGNGDLRIAWLLLSVFQTYTLLAILLHAPTSRTARRNLWAATRGIFTRDAARLAALAELLASGNDAETIGESSTRGGLLLLLRAPFILAASVVQLLTMLGSMLVFGPALGALWRARRYLADATSVQLTRNPDGLANALHRLSGGGAFPDGRESRLLFIVWGDAAGTGTSGFSIPGGLHPAIARRIRRLQAAGARVRRTSRHTVPLPLAPPSWAMRIAMPFFLLFMAFAYAFTAVAFLFLIGVTVLLSALSIAITAFAIAAIHWFFGALPELPAMVRTAAEIARDLYRLLRDLVVGR